jgi:hypothetical protein
MENVKKATARKCDLRTNLFCVKMSRVKAKYADLAMPKNFEDPPKEPARKRAERKWSNNDVRTRFKEAKAQPASKEPKDLGIADVIKNEELEKGTITKAQTKFARYIKSLLDDHKQRNAQRNMIYYAISIRAQRKRLLTEKLRRLEARAAQQNQGNLT